MLVREQPSELIVPSFFCILLAGNGVYNIPNHGALVYCGLEGYISVLRPIIENNDLGHPFCAHLREGHWALDYVCDRIQRFVYQAVPLSLHAHH